MRMRQIGAPVTIATLLLFFAFGSAKADETVVYFRAIPTATLVTTIEGRQKDLEKAINEARDRGDISSAQCAAMKQELRRIAQETGSNTVSYPVALMLAEDLDLIGQQYGTIVTTAPTYVPIITGSTFTVYTGQTYKLDDLSMRRAGLEARITKDLLQGRLSDSRAADLRSQLAGIGNEADLYLADGSFNPKESRRLYDSFDNVEQKIDKLAGKENYPQ
jgi:hypothetical protein